MRMPSIFLSHESPYLWDTASPVRTFLTTLADALPRPKAIIVVSAHWNTSVPTISSIEHPQAIYDFGGFEEHYYQIKYAPPGSPDLAARVTQLAARNDILVLSDDTRGLDHAVWIPVGLMYPQADIPVVSLSVQPRSPAKHHYLLGQCLSELRREDILIIGSGTATHNIGAFFANVRPEISDPPSESAAGFDRWLIDHINDHEAILNYRKSAPYAAACHPTVEHFLPLIVAMGAGGAGGAGGATRAQCIHHSFNYSHFAMTAFQWG